MDWSQEDMGQFTTLLKEIDGDAAVFEENSEQYVEVRSPTDLEDSMVAKFGGFCPFPVRVVVGIKHATQGRLEMIGSMSGLNRIDILGNQDPMEIRITFTQEPRLPAETLFGMILGCLATDAYVSKVAFFVNEIPVSEVLNIAEIRGNLQSLAESFISRMKARREAEENQAKGSLTDENIARISEINTVDDLLKM